MFMDTYQQHLCKKLQEIGVGPQVNAYKQGFLVFIYLRSNMTEVRLG